MRKIFLVTAIMAIASFVFTACDPAANTNTTNKPANAANNAATAPVNTAAIETDIKKLVSDVGAALVKNDVDALDKLYGDNYTLVDIDGSVKTKAERFAGLKSGEVKFESITYGEIGVRVNPEGTGAVSIHLVTVKAKNKGVATDGQIRVTTVWSKTKDGWKAVSAQATRITAAAPAAGLPTPVAPKPGDTAPANANTNRNTNTNR